MKKLLFTIIIGIFTVSFNSEPTFEDGFEIGHCEGWKDVRGQLVVCPIAPIAPIPEVDCSTYNCGYNRGFLRGRKDARK